MGGSPDRSNGYAKRYCWPASALGEEEMRLLYEEKVRTGKPITMLIQEAVIRALRKDASGQAVAETLVNDGQATV